MPDLTSAAANGALDGFVTGAAVEMPRGIRINAVSPEVLQSCREKVISEVIRTRFLMEVRLADNGLVCQGKGGVFQRRSGGSFRDRLQNMDAEQPGDQDSQVELADDHFQNRQPIKILTVIDEYTRQCLAIVAEQRLRAGDVPFLPDRSICQIREFRLYPIGQRWGDHGGEKIKTAVQEK